MPPSWTGHLRTLIRSSIASLISIAIELLLVQLLDIAGVEPVISYIIVQILGTIMTFAGNKYWAFEASRTGRTITEGSRAAEGRWMNADTISETYLERGRGLNAIAEARGQSLAQLALLWVLRQPSVTSALIGASSVAQLEDNLAALDGAALTAEELAAIEPLAVHNTGR